jgi:transglutaminase-like putative cysteine protease
MPRFIFWVINVFAVAVAAAALPAQVPYQIGPPPAWVKLHKPNLAAPSLATEGWEYLLSDHQQVVGPSGIERYWHVAYRVLDEGAVKENSQLAVDFDTTYQELVLHTVRVLRGDRVIDQLKPARMHVAQRESQLEYQIFDGTLSVVVLLEDVRRGDVIDYSFTRRGNNPVFRGHFMTRFRIQESVPMQQRYVRLLWQRARPPHIRPHRTELQPSVVTAGATREYVWSRHNIPALDVESNIPDWYDPFPAVQISDFDSWGAVAAWGDSLFPDAKMPTELAAVVARLRAASESPEQRTLQALRFVQDEIRYMGVEIGVNSHTPYSPAVVMRRRYGDCKDKTHLLVTMLRALGITARPALVSTTYGAHLSDFHPTAGVFDHAIVQVELSGRPYWIDPSGLYERGDLSDVAASYGAALVLGGPSDSLVPMVTPARPGPLTDIVVSFDLNPVGDSTSMRVDTRYVGSTANAMRSSLRSSSSTELQQQYAEYYARLYPSIRSEQAPVIEDDEAANVLRVTESYTIPEFWTGDSAEGLIGRFEPLELSSAMPNPTGTERRMPLAVKPAHLRYTINAHLKEGWSIEGETERIKTPAARFAYASKVRDKVLTLSYEYETTADHVMPAAATSHIKSMARAGDMLLYRVTPPSGSSNTASGGFNWSVLFAAAFACVIACFAAVRVGRARFAVAGVAGSPTAGIAPGAIRPGEPVGLGGWLVLVGLGVTVSPIRLLVQFIQTLPSYNAATWGALTTPGAARYDAAWAPLLMFELVGNITLLVFSVLVVWLYYGRKRQFPTVFSWVIVLSWLFVMADSLLTGLVPLPDPDPVNWAGDFGRLIIALVWVQYMRRSVRVRNTFVN